MTFRIDGIRNREAGKAWVFDIKGYEGRGIYVHLCTDEHGEGLFVLEYLPHSLRPLTPLTRFNVPPDVTPAEAGFELAQHLLDIGWGPWVDQAGNIIQHSPPDDS